MRAFLILLPLSLATAAGAQSVPQPDIAQSRMTPAKPTKVVARSGRLVTARTSTGGTRSYNCKKAENAKRAICKH